MEKLKIELSQETGIVLIKLIGYLDAEEGEILIDEKRMHTGSLELRKKIGLVPQTLALYDEISAKENLEIFGSFYGIDKKELRYIIADKLKMGMDTVDRINKKLHTGNGYKKVLKAR